MDTKTTSLKPQRNYGIDFLRLFSMFLIVILHVSGHGGVLSNTTGFNYNFAYVIRTLAMCAVDIFAMISGYVGFREIDNGYKYSKYLRIWAPVFFYSVIIAVIYNAFFAESVNVGSLITSFLPIITKKYWYFTSYTVVFFVAPIINMIVRNTQPRLLNFYTLVIFGITAYTMADNIISQKSWLYGGYFWVWLAILYYIGAWIKKSQLDKKLNVKIGLLINIILSVIVALGTIFVNEQFSSYTSPFIFVISIVYLCIFSKLKLSNSACKVVKSLAPAAFGVYLIHDNEIIRANIISKLYLLISDLNPAVFPFAEILVFIGVFTICLSIEKLRIKLFDILKINKFFTSLETKIDNLLAKIFKKISK